MKETDLAWAAGFLEGEGCFYISLSRNGRNAHSTISAKQVDKTPLLKLQRMFGGNLYYREPGGKRSPVWIWMASTTIVCEYLPLLIPFLTGVKKAQAKELLKFASRCQDRTDNGRWFLTDKEIQYRFKSRDRLSAMKLRAR